MDLATDLMDGHLPRTAGHTAGPTAGEAGAGPGSETGGKRPWLRTDPMNGRSRRVRSAARPSDSRRLRKPIPAYGRAHGRGPATPDGERPSGLAGAAAALAGNG